jgi:hypothetical protein
MSKIKCELEIILGAAEASLFFWDGDQKLKKKAPFLQYQGQPNLAPGTCG